MANEKRLIDANAFLKDILTAGIGKTIIEYSESDIAYMIRKRPTEDALVQGLQVLRNSQTESFRELRTEWIYNSDETRRFLLLRRKKGR